MIIMTRRECRSPCDAIQCGNKKRPLTESIEQLICFLFFLPPTCPELLSEGEAGCVVLFDYG